MKRAVLLISAILCALAFTSQASAAPNNANLTVSCALNGATIVDGYQGNPVQVELEFTDVNGSRAGAADWLFQDNAPPKAPETIATPTDLDYYGLPVYSVLATVTYEEGPAPGGNPWVTYTVSAVCN